LGDAGRDAAYERNLALYVENTRASLRRVYDTTVHDKGEEIPASPQPPAVMPVVRSHEQVVMELKLAKAKLKPVTAASRRGANGIHDEEVGDRAILQFQHQGSGDHDELAFNWGNGNPYFDSLPQEPEDKKMNCYQRVVFNYILTYLRRLNRHHHMLREMPVPVPRLLVHGPAGTGKTFTMMQIMEGAELYGYRCLPLAFQGSAAANLPGGLTIHHFTKSGVDDKGEGSHGIMALGMQAIREILVDVRVIIIDEISMVAPRLLYRLHDTLQQATGNMREPFGGLAVVALGE